MIFLKSSKKLNKFILNSDSLPNKLNNLYRVFSSWTKIKILYI